MKLIVRYIFLMLFVLVDVFSVNGQKKNASYEKYISLYNHLAIQQEKKYNIPSSIKLAQALLESGAGQAKLAKESKNHFGIKCHSDWNGGRVYKSDDKPNECFRKYNSISESYEDHSKFLVERSRYEKLFKLKKTDYRGWAKGLQKCGYATDRGYANKLIGIIEIHQLYMYDTGGRSGKKASKSAKKKISNQKNTQIKTTTPKIPLTNDGKVMRPHDIYKTYGLVYVMARYNDSFEEIAKELGFKVNELAKYNEVPTDFPLRQGDLVYLEKKKKKADKPYYNHKVQIGESMHGISQQYGIQMKSLYKMNNKESDYIPEEGDMLKLR